METGTNTTAYDEHRAYMKKLQTADHYDKCGRCGRPTDSIYPYCVKCAEATGRGNTPTWGGVAIEHRTLLK